MTLLSRFFLLAVLLPTVARAADKPKLEPAAPAATPAPSTVDFATFEYSDNGEGKKVIVTMSPTLIRFDELDDGYSFIYNQKTDFYTGLENRNYTYWTFSWPEVRTAVENSTRYAKRLQEIGSASLNDDDDNKAPAKTTTTPNTANLAAAGSSLGTDSGYVWKQTKDKNEISGFQCTRWIGDTISGEKMEAWCFDGKIPKAIAAVAALKKVSDPMALVPIRTVAPDNVYAVYDALVKGGATPVLINWGGDHGERGQFRLVDAKSQPYKESLFTIPKTFQKTTLVTMDGMTDKQPARDPRGTNVAPRVDHMTPPAPIANPNE